MRAFPAASIWPQAERTFGREFNSAGTAHISTSCHVVHGLNGRFLVNSVK